MDWLAWASTPGLWITSGLVGHVVVHWRMASTWIVDSQLSRPEGVTLQLSDAYQAWATEVMGQSLELPPLHLTPYLDIRTWRRQRCWSVYLPSTLRPGLARGMFVVHAEALPGRTTLRVQFVDDDDRRPRRRRGNARVRALRLPALPIPTLPSPA